MLKSLKNFLLVSLILFLTGLTVVEGKKVIIGLVLIVVVIFLIKFLIKKDFSKKEVPEIEYDPNDDFIALYNRLGMKEDISREIYYPYFLGEREEGKNVIYAFKSNGNKLNVFEKGKELIEEFMTEYTHDKLSTIRRSTLDKGVIEVVYAEEECIKRINIYSEISKVIENPNIIPMNSLLDWNYRDAPHALITGITKGGKTYELFYLIRQLLARNADMYVIDPKLSDLSTLDSMIGDKCVYEKEDILKLVKKFANEMKNRYREIRSREDFKAGKDYFDYGYKPKFLIFDECMSYFGGSTEQGDKKTVKGHLLDIIAEGRQAGYFVILTTQRADTKFIDGAIRDQLGLRMSLGHLSSDGYKMTFGSTDYKLKDMTKGAGFIYIDGLGMERAKEYISPYIPDSYDFFADFRSLVGEIKPKQVSLEKEKKVKEAKVLAFPKKAVNGEGVVIENLEDLNLEELRDIPDSSAPDFKPKM